MLLITSWLLSLLSQWPMAIHKNTAIGFSNSGQLNDVLMVIESCIKMGGEVAANKKVGNKLLLEQRVWKKGSSFNLASWAGLGILLTAPETRGQVFKEYLQICEEKSCWGRGSNVNSSSLYLTFCPVSYKIMSSQQIIIVKSQFLLHKKENNHFLFLARK